MALCFYCSSLSPTILFSTSHIRSFCVSFLLLAILFTFINFLTTTTSINKLITTDYTTDPTSTTIKASSPLLLSLSSEDFYQNRFNCYGGINRQRLHRKKKKQKKNSTIIVELNQPNKISFEENVIPYDYDTWQSAPSMPRLVTKCEHDLMMNLLTRFDKLAKKYSLEYMMTDGTLLGSWRHHDVIPWDDDIDLLMSVKLKHNLNLAIELESPSSPYSIEFYRQWDAPKAFEYYKFYFSISPRFSEHPWRYPFVDLIFYHENQTHIWQENMQHLTSISKKSIFPLKLRPLGSLWLPAPKSPHDYFLSVSWNTYEDECFNNDWSHKYERTRDISYDTKLKSKIDCKQLYEFYPFVERSLNNQEERLVINGTIKQIIKMINE